MPQPTVDAILTAYDRAVQDVRDRVVRFARTAWQSSPDVRDANVARLVRLLVPRVQAGQLQIANLTNAYIRQIATLDGVPVQPARVDRDEILGYRGVPASEVYRRPAVQTYTALAGGSTVTEALASGAARLLSIVSTDLQQARNRQARAGFARSGYEYTERTLTGRENCALCVIASTQRYHVAAGQLMPIHPGCDCGQKGVKAATDPGQVINPQLLQSTQAAVKAKFGHADTGARFLSANPNPNDLSDYLDLIVTHEHGELGPTLAWRGDHFTGPDDLH